MKKNNLGILIGTFLVICMGCTKGKHLKNKSVSFNVSNDSVEFEVPEFENSTVTISSNSSDFDILYLEKDRTYDESPRPVSVRSLELMGAIPRKAKHYDKNEYDFEYVPWSELKSDSTHDVTIIGTLSAGYKVVIPIELPFDQKKIYETLAASFRRKK